MCLKKHKILPEKEKTSKYKHYDKNKHTNKEVSLP